MTPTSPVVHVIAAERANSRAGTLVALLRRSSAPLIQVGPPGSIAAELAEQPRPECVRAPLGLPWLGARALRVALDRSRAAILHVWSAAALDWCMPALAAPTYSLFNWGLAPASQQRGGAGGRAVLVELDTVSNARRCARWHAQRPGGVELWFVCSSSLVQRQLGEQGVPASRCVLIRDVVSAQPVEPERRAALRASLKLRERDCGILVLPPIERASDPYRAVWAGLLLERVRAEIKLIVPSGGGLSRRLRRLIEVGQAGDLGRFPSLERTPLPDLVAAADLAVFTPQRDAPLSAVCEAMAGHCPLVATDTPSVAELLVDGRSAWLCRPNDPRDICQRMLQAIEAPADSKRQAGEAARQAHELFNVDRLLEQYAQLYATAAPG